jgi:hypothetical protein
MSPVKYELGFYIPEYDIFHSHCCENLKSYIQCLCWSQETAQEEYRELLGTVIQGKNAFQRLEHAVTNS